MRAWPRDSGKRKEPLPLLVWVFDRWKYETHASWNARLRLDRERPDALVLLADPLTMSQRLRIVEFAEEERLPAIYETSQFVDSGGLMSYGPNTDELVRRSAIYVDKILKGSKPADLPIEQPLKFELVINLKTAKALGITIPQSVLLQADRVIN